MPSEEGLPLQAFAPVLLARLEQRNRAAPFWIGEAASHSWGALIDDLHRWCGIFDLGQLRKGDRVVAVTGDDWAATTLFLAACLDGLVPTILSPDAGDARIVSVLEATSASLLLTDPRHAAAMWAHGAVLAGEEANAGAAVHADVGQTSLAQLMEITPIRRPSGAVAATDLAYLLFTSGTTGAPKGAMLSHGNLAAQMSDLETVLQIGPRARIGNGLVLSHTDGLIQGPLLAAWTGATLLRPERFAVTQVSAMLDFLSTHGVTHLIGSPTIYEMIDRYAGSAAGFGPDIAVLLSSAAPLAPSLWDALERRFGAAVVNEYGMTETVAASHFAGPLPGMGARYTIGQPVGCTACLRDPVSDIETPAGEIGELCISGPPVFMSYLGNPEATAARLRDGWLRTGDLARQLDNGSYRIEGRLSTAFNSGGFLILPEEVDEALAAARTVRDAKTIGLPDPRFGAITVSFVVTDAALDLAALDRHCRARLEDWKVPRHILGIEQIPSSASGKADIGALERLAAARFAESFCSSEVTGTHGDLRALIEEVFHMDPGSAVDDMGPEQIPGWDSYAHTALVLELEDRLAVEFSAEDAQAMKTIRDILDICARAGGR